MLTVTVRLQPDAKQSDALWRLGADYGQLKRTALKLLQQGESAPSAEQELRRRYPGWSRRWLRSAVSGASALRTSRIEGAKAWLVGFPERLRRLEKRLEKAKRQHSEGARGYARRRDRMAAKGREMSSITSGQLEPSIVFGGQKLLKERARLETEAEIADWQERWREARDGEFYCIGDRDRQSGNGMLQLDLEREALRIRLPNSAVAGAAGAGAPNDSSSQVLIIPIAGLDYCRADLEQALVRDERGRTASPVTVCVFYRSVKQAWYAALTITPAIAPYVSSRKNGALGVDVNPDHLALCLISADGNPRQWWKLPLDLMGTARQNADAIGLAARDVIALAAEHGVPLVTERLDFGKARMNLRYLPPRLARLLSSFAYQKILSSLESRASRCAVELIKVSPAWSSVLGQANYAVPYGVSVDQASACVLARRGLGLREQPRPSIPLSSPVDGVKATAQAPSQTSVKPHPRATQQARLRLLAHSLPKRSSTWGHAGLAARKRCGAASADCGITPAHSTASDSAPTVKLALTSESRPAPRGVVVNPGLLFTQEQDSSGSASFGR